VLTQDILTSVGQLSAFMLQLVPLKPYTGLSTRSARFFRLTMDHQFVSLRRSQG